MYLRRVELKNIKSITHLTWEIIREQAPGWHVLLGDNGAGKTTFIQSVALSLLGSNINALRIDWKTWGTYGKSDNEIKLNIFVSEDYDFLMRQPISDLRNELHLSLPIPDRKELEETWGFNIKEPDVATAHGIFIEAMTRAPRGWFSASYGPFRRFTGGDAEAERLFRTNPHLARHLTAFGENTSLADVISALKDLRFRELDKDEAAQQLLEKIKQFVNQSGFLPNKVRLKEVNPDGVHFVDSNDCKIMLEELSDGYRSILSLTLDLLRQLTIAYGGQIFETVGDSKIIIKVPGVVLIDEIDAHLHPTWQKEIGFWFREHFPNIQFIVTTHSPLVCQAAEKGTIFQLPKPGTEEQGRFITGVERDRLLYGNILDAYSTEAFGSGVTQANATEEKLERLSELNSKEMYLPLTPEEKTEQERLRAMLPTSASILTPK